MDIAAHHTESKQHRVTCAVKPAASQPVSMIEEYELEEVSGEQRRWAAQLLGVCSSRWRAPGR
jgi:hypothetical protein